MKIQIGWTVLRDGKAIGQAQGSYSSRLSRLVTPVYDSLGKARRAATVRGLPYDAIVEAFVELPSAE
jgi:hypothetical protein